MKDKSADATVRRSRRQLLFAMGLSTSFSGSVLDLGDNRATTAKRLSERAVGQARFGSEGARLLELE
jgi:hypothetical protein